MVGDVIPYYANGGFRIFFLQIWRVPDPPEMGWYSVGTKDFLHFKEYGPCQIPGGTGSVLEAGGLYHMYYCVFPEGHQVICHATSTDLLHWQKQPEDDFGPAPEYYQASDWRDPFVFWNEEEGEYWMLVAARDHSKYNRSGCVGLCVSHDLKTWQDRPSLYAPDLYTSALECADLFRMGDWWYLVYSTYTDRFATHYRMSRSSCGPWLAPVEDTFDGRAFYAAKTASDGMRRYVFGWNPTRTENHFNWNPPGYAGKDYNTWDWGGHLVIHEIVQSTDGTLQVRLPEAVSSAFQQELPVILQPELGAWQVENSSVAVSSPYGFACATAGNLPDPCLLSFHFCFKPGTRRLGMILRASEKLDQGYTIQIEPDRNRVVYKSFVFPDEHGGKILPYEVELERPLTLIPDQDYSVKLVLEGSLCEIYFNNQVAMSTRLYDLSDGKIAFFVVSGEASFENITLKNL